MRVRVRARVRARVRVRVRARVRCRVRSLPRTKSDTLWSYSSVPKVLVRHLGVITR